MLLLKYMLHEQLKTLNQMQDCKRPIARVALGAARVAYGFIDKRVRVFKQCNRGLAHASGCLTTKLNGGEAVRIERPVRTLPPGSAPIGRIGYLWRSNPMDGCCREFDTLTIDRERIVGTQGDGSFECRLDEVEKIRIEIESDSQSSPKKIRLIQQAGGKT